MLTDDSDYILVVEDDAAIREAIASVILDEDGPGVKGAGDGRAALDILLESPPPLLILLDLMMPVMDGIEFLHEKNRRPALAGIPVCVMSARQRSGVKLLGVDDFLQKPFELDALLSVVGRYAPAPAQVWPKRIVR
jgi:CheY-like chemotaxis protein